MRFKNWFVGVNFNASEPITFAALGCFTDTGLEKDLRFSLKYIITPLRTIKRYIKSLVNNPVDYRDATCISSKTITNSVSNLRDIVVALMKQFNFVWINTSGSDRDLKARRTDGDAVGFWPIRKQLLLLLISGVVLKGVGSVHIKLLPTLNSSMWPMRRMWNVPAARDPLPRFFSLKTIKIIHRYGNQNPSWLRN